MRCRTFGGDEAFQLILIVHRFEARLKTILVNTLVCGKQFLDVSARVYVCV